MANLSETNRQLLGAFGLVMLGLLLTSFVVSKRFYLPVSAILGTIKRSWQSEAADPGPLAGEIELLSKAALSMVERMNELDDWKQDSLQSRHTQALRDMLAGEGLILEESVAETLRFFKLATHANEAFGVIVIRMDHFDDFVRNNSQEAIDFQLNSIGSIAVQAIGHEAPASFVRMDDEHLAVVTSVVQERQAMYQWGITATMRQVQDTIYRLLKLEVTVGISEASGTVRDLRQAYAQAAELTRYRLFYGRRRVFDARITSSPEYDGEFRLNRLLQDLLAAVKDDDRDRFVRQFESLFQICCRQGYHFYLDTLARLVDQMMSIPAAASQTAANGTRLKEIYTLLQNFESSYDLLHWLLELFDKVTLYLNGLNQSGAYHLVEQAQRYIAEHYADSMLSANSVGEQLHISGQYLGKLMKEHTGLSFPDYVNQVRLEKAKTLILNEPEMDIKTICQRVGYNNGSYFSALFKARYGMTPSKLRIHS